jgi:hypothetical protein
MSSPSRVVSVFIRTHSSLLDVHLGQETNPQGVIEYHSEITCEPLPENVRLNTPNVLGKSYYLDPRSLKKFISNTQKGLGTGEDFSKKIASRLNEFENEEVKQMFKLLDQCDEELASLYEKGGQPLPQQKTFLLKVQDSKESKVGIEWYQLDKYIVQKKYTIPHGDHMNDGLIVCIQDQGKIEMYESNNRVIRGGRFNLAEILTMLSEWKDLNLLLPSDQIRFFDFGCNDPVFKNNPDDIRFKYHWNLLSFTRDGAGAIMTYGTIRLDEHKKRCRDAHSTRVGVGIGEEPTSQLSLGSSSSSESQSQSQSTPSPSPARAMPLLHVHGPDG